MNIIDDLIRDKNKTRKEKESLNKIIELCKENAKLEKERNIYKAKAAIAAL